MASNQRGSNADRLTHPLLENLGPLAAATESLFAYSAKIVCGRQIDSSCCCLAGVRPGVYATKVNIQNINLVTAPVLKFILPLINSGAVVAREPDIADAATLSKNQVEIIKIPPLGQRWTMLSPRAEATGRDPERRPRAHHRDSDDREPIRTVRLHGLHGDLSERERHQHRRRVRSIATSAAPRPRLTGMSLRCACLHSIARSRVRKTRPGFLCETGGDQARVAVTLGRSVRITSEELARKRQFGQRRGTAPLPLWIQLVNATRARFRRRNSKCLSNRY